MMRTTPRTTIHTPHHRKAVFFHPNMHRVILNCGDVSFIRDEQSSSLFTRQPFPGYGRQLQRQGDIVQKEFICFPFATWLLFPSFGFDAPKTGWLISGLLAPFWLRSGFHALPPCRPALSGCTVFCADFFYRVFFTIPVTLCSSGR